MAKNKVSEWSSTASNNTDIGGVNIAEGCAPSGINNAIRELMAQVKDMQTGADSDNLVVGGAFTCSGAAVFSSTVSLSSALPVASGGTGVNSVTTGDILYASAVDTFSKLTGAGTTGSVLLSGTAPSWGKVALASAVSGTLPVANGGTGTTTSTGTGSVVLSASPTISSPTFTGSPVAPTPTSGDSSTKVATTAFVSSAVAGGVPSGCILMWSGSVATIPSGWYLCNGANGTPDLRNRFVVGAGSTYSVGGTGGSADAITVSHTHSVTDPGHNHAVPNSNANGSVDGSFVYGEYGTSAIAYDNHTSSATTGISISSTGSSGTNANLPPYYALAYIMKA